MGTPFVRQITVAPIPEDFFASGEREKDSVTEKNLVTTYHGKINLWNHRGLQNHFSQAIIQERYKIMENLDLLVKELCKLPDETGCVEFKHNNDEPHMIGEDISALDTI